jgi:hypothetical protein
MNEIPTVINSLFLKLVSSVLLGKTSPFVPIYTPFAPSQLRGNLP